MKVYVGTYGKYNAGSINGAWLNLEDYTDKDEFLEACAELHKDEADPEFMFQDWEDIPDGMISESRIDEKAWDLLDAFDEFDEGAVRAYIKCFGGWSRGDFEDRYRGEWSSWGDMGESVVGDLGYLDEIPEYLQCYFDYEKFAQDMRVSGDMIEHGGYFFWNH